MHLTPLAHSLNASVVDHRRLLDLLRGIEVVDQVSKVESIVVHRWEYV